MNRKMLSLFFVIFICVCSSNAFAEKLRSRLDWNHMFFDALEDIRIRPLEDTKLLDDLFAEDKTYSEKYEAAKLIHSLYEFYASDLDEAAIPLSKSKNLLKFLVYELKDDDLKIAIFSDYFRVVDSVDADIDEYLKLKQRKQLTFGDIVVLLNRHICETYDIEYSEYFMDSLDAVFFKKVKDLMQKTSWYERKKNNQIIRETVQAIDDLVEEIMLAKVDKKILSISDSGTVDVGGRKVDFLGYFFDLENKSSDKIDDELEADKKINADEYVNTPVMKTIINRYLNAWNFIPFVRYLEANKEDPYLFLAVYGVIEDLDLSDFERKSLMESPWAKKAVEKKCPWFFVQEDEE